MVMLQIESIGINTCVLKFSLLDKLVQRKQKKEARMTKQRHTDLEVGVYNVIHRIFLH